MEGITALLLAALVATVHAQLQPVAPGAGITIGANCNNENDCAIRNAQCIASSCQCKHGYQQFNDPSTVGVVKSFCAMALGSQCTADSDCVTSAKCLDQKCSCSAADGYVPSRDNSRCLHKTNDYNTTCEGTTQCADSWGDGITCDSANKTCVCMPDYNFYVDKCYFSLAYGKQCTPNDNKQRCYLPADGNNQHVTCGSKNTCECEKGYKPTNDQTKCKIPDGHCLANEDCTHVLGMHSACYNGTCKCKYNHHLHNKTCYFNLNLGDDCMFESLKERCYLPLDGAAQHVECGPSKKCQCSSGYKPHNNSTQCARGSATTATVSALLFSSVILLKLTSF